MNHFIIQFLEYINNLILIFLCINVLYVLSFSLASLRKCKVPSCSAVKSLKRFVILIAAYKEDKVILDPVRACLNFDYPKDKFDIIVISDQMQPETNATLSALDSNVLVHVVNFENSSNTKSLKSALSYLGSTAHYDIALILDADNIVDPNYLNELNKVFNVPGVQAVQTHRVAKNKNTTMAYLDAVSEEINNSIWRKGHVNLGLPSLLIGSGMAFDYSVFYEEMMTNESVGGFDRVLAMKLLSRKIFIHYLPDTYVLDEKIQDTKGFYNQRGRWIAAQYIALLEFLPKLTLSIKERNWGVLDLIVQHIALPRLLLLGFIVFELLISILLQTSQLFGICLLTGLLLIALAVAIPQKLWSLQLLKAVVLLPKTFFLMFLNLFRIKAANKRFIHTQHGVK